MSIYKETNGLFQMLKPIQALFLGLDFVRFLRIMSSYKEISIISVCCLVTTSCRQLEMEDVSSAEKYSHAIGVNFKTKDELWAIGVTSDKNYRKRVDYIVLVPGVGFSGPEVVTKNRVGKGSVFQVVRVLKASSFVSSRMIYVVQNVGTNTFRDTSIHVQLTGEINDRNLGLNESIYEMIK